MNAKAIPLLIEYVSGIVIIAITAGADSAISSHSISVMFLTNKTATLWKKKKSTFEPDYCAVRLKSDPWIVQPFEHYEEIRIEELKNKHKKKG